MSAITAVAPAVSLAWTSFRTASATASGRETSSSTSWLLRNARCFLNSLRTASTNSAGNSHAGRFAPTRPVDRCSRGFLRPGWSKETASIPPRLREHGGDQGAISPCLTEAFTAITSWREGHWPGTTAGPIRRQCPSPRPEQAATRSAAARKPASSELLRRGGPHGHWGWVLPPWLPITWSCMGVDRSSVRSFVAWPRQHASWTRRNQPRPRCAEPGPRAHDSACTRQRSHEVVSRPVAVIVGLEARTLVYDEF